jgi:heat shock protein HslJ
MTLHRVTLRSATRSATVLAAVAALTLSACGDDDDDAADAPTAEQLDGRVFRATDTDGHDIVEGSEVTMTFTGDQLSVSTGCNNLVGGFTIEGGKLVTADMASTMMACEEPLAAQEEWVTAFLGSSPTIELDGSELDLDSGDDSIDLSEVG